jgi:hypothetical protein
MFFRKLFAQFLKIWERRIAHNTPDLMIFICVHQRSHSSHAPPPNTDTAHCSDSSQVFKYAVHIVSLVKSQWNIFALGQSAACKVEGEDGDVSADEKMNISFTKSRIIYPSTLQLLLPWR